MERVLGMFQARLWGRSFMTLRMSRTSLVCTVCMLVALFIAATKAPLSVAVAIAGVLGLILLSPIHWLMAEGSGSSKWGTAVLMFISIALIYGGLR